VQNHGVTIYLGEKDKTDLKDILQIVGELGKQSIWKLSDVECFGKSAEILHKFSDNEKVISGKEFYNVVSDIHQTLDGVFEAYKPDEITHWLLIRAIRGDEFDIETKDEELLKTIRNSFKNVKDLAY
jgi:hypothetical protein